MTYRLELRGAADTEENLVMLFLRETLGSSDLFNYRRSRPRITSGVTSGSPYNSVVYWIPAYAGMTKKTIDQKSPYGFYDLMR